MRGLILSIALVLVTATGARAQDSAERARQLFTLGVAAMDRGQPGEAATHFDQSFRLHPSASTACNMGLVQERLARPCDALGWYQQCAALDRVGDKREHANQQVALLAPRCAPPAPVHDPFVREPAPTASSVQIVEAGAPVASGPGPDHTLLGFGITGLVLGLGGLGGGIGAALEAEAAAAQLPRPPGPIMAGTPEGDALERASLFSDVALGLYIGGAVIGALGLIALIVDLAQPGAFGGRAARGGLQLTFAPAGGGLALRF
jgi:hypothetical protein